jgi:hypothetical protein
MIRSLGLRDAINASRIFDLSIVEAGVVIMPGPRTIDELESTLGRPLASYKKGGRIVGKSMSGSRYTYVLAAAPGDLPQTFRPDLTPGEMLMLGVFEGKYLNDSTSEFPADWYVGAIAMGRLSPAGPDPVRCNFFGVKSRQPLSVWRENGWAPSANPPPSDHYHGILASPATNPDERGWFQWYCRYWLGRRLPIIDDIQIKRWRAFRRHAGAIRANCPRGDLTCRPRERQALLQWAYNPFI